MSRLNLINILASLALLGLTSSFCPAAFAQGEPYRFQPPRAPPEMDEFDDEDAFEMTDEPPFRPPNAGGIQPGAGQIGGNPFPPSGNMPPPPNGNGDFRPAPPRVTSPKDFRFQVVEGEYWQKGKKRTRGTKTQVTSSAQESSKRR